MDISEVRLRCIYEAIGWFRIGFCNVTCFEEEALGGSRGDRPNRACVDIKNIDCVSLPLACFYQYIRICSHLMLYWAFCIGDVFSCILKIEL